MKIKFEDNPTNFYMLSPQYLRLYQCAYTQTDDLKLLNKTNFLPGYTFKPRDPSKPRTPCLIRNWHDFPLNGFNNIENVETFPCVRQRRGRDGGGL